MTGQTWGYEVVVPERFNFMLADRAKVMTMRNGAAPASAAPAARRSRAADDRAYLLVPAGAQGPGFLMLQNFRVIMKYNPSEAYALAIGYLADRLRGGEPLVQPWPRYERVLTRDERLELQQLLAHHGFDVGTPDGQLGGRTRAALRSSRPRSASWPTVLPRRRSWNGCAGRESRDSGHPARQLPWKSRICRLMLLTAVRRCPVYGAESARLRPDSATIAIASAIPIAAKPHVQAEILSPGVHRKPARWSRWPWRSRCWSAIVGPASAQFFNFGGPARRGRNRQHGRSSGGGGGGWFGGDFFAPFQQQAPQARRSRIFPRRRRRTSATRACRSATCWCSATRMADWLAYGLEDAYAEQPDMGVIRKHKTVSGLISYQPKGDPADWAAAAKGILATEKPDAIVVMLGLNDRVAMREPAADKATDKKADKKDARAKPDAKPATTRRQAGRQAGRHRGQARRQAGRYRIVAG